MIASIAAATSALRHHAPGTVGNRGLTTASGAAGPFVPPLRIRAITAAATSIGSSSTASPVRPARTASR